MTQSLINALMKARDLISAAHEPQQGEHQFRSEWDEDADKVLQEIDSALFDALHEFKSDTN